MNEWMSILYQVVHLGKKPQVVPLIDWTGVLECNHFLCNSQYSTHIRSRDIIFATILYSGIINELM
jgi:hypothetical protein